MCFSPQADFTAGAVVVAVGVETLRRVRVRRELIVGALPLLFGIHQLVEGFVWLGLRGEVSVGLGDAAKEIYIVFAHAVLPALLPAATERPEVRADAKRCRQPRLARHPDKCASSRAGVQGQLGPPVSEPVFSDLALSQ
jgi:hypothetical protein